jgi:hypothetical protein
MSAVDEIETALQALAERGEWHGRPGDDAELIRVEIRRAARKAKINVRTSVDSLGRPHAYTRDGWPAHEPWRGAAIHAYESGAEGAAFAAVMERYDPRRRDR